MELNQITLVVCITLALVLAFNAALYLLAKRKQGSVSEFELFRRAVRRSRNPWSEENAKLEALSRKVAELRDAQPDAETSSDQT